MYKIVKDGTYLGMTEAPTYIRQAENGCFVLTSEEEAHGIAVGGVPYHLLGRDPLNGVETVMLTQTDGGAELESVNATNGVLFVTLAEAGSIDAVTAGEHAELFAEWTYPVSYTVGQIRRYNGALYKCVQAHTSQADWTPDAVASLWSLTADPSEEWPEWSQPVGAHDAYALGDRVSHNDKHWTSTVDNNCWEPGVYGWEEVTDE